jgi:predicted nuclease of predicted toxin-antitoxin system
LRDAEDHVILDRAAADDRIIVSVDTDFSTILAASTRHKPSVIQFRGPGSRRPEPLAHAILSNLSQTSEALESGSIVTFEPSRLRVRALPIGGPAAKA